MIEAPVGLNLGLSYSPRSMRRKCTAVGETLKRLARSLRPATVVSVFFVQILRFRRFAMSVAASAGEHRRLSVSKRNLICQLH